MNRLNQYRTVTGSARIAAAFRGKKALIGRLVGGDPTPQASLELARAMIRAGADALLICLPFSDPVAESEEQCRANLRALQAGSTPDTVLDLVAGLRAGAGDALPLMLVSYLNPLFHYGYKAFLTRCAEVGVDGLLIPDLPVEERCELQGQAREQGVALLSFIAPAPPARLAAVAQAAEGLLLAAGMDAGDGEALAGLAEALQGQGSPPLAVALGNAGPEQAALALRVADGLVVDGPITTSITVVLSALRRGALRRG